jgi:PAS domain S-box-containing protein
MKSMNFLQAVATPGVRLFDQDAAFRRNPMKVILGGGLSSAFTGDLNRKSNSVNRSQVVSPFNSINKLPSAESIVAKVRTMNRRNLVPAKSITAKLEKKELLTQTTSLTWFIDEEDRLVHANEQLLTCLGIGKGDLNKKITEVVPELILRKLYEEHVKVRTSGIPGKKIMFLPMPDGASSYFLINIYPFTNQYGKNIVVGEAFDITYIFQVQEEMSKTNDRLMNMSRVTTEAIWEWEITTGNVFRNERLVSMIGTTNNKKFDPEWWYSLVHPEDRMGVKEKLENVLKLNQTTWEHEFRFKKGEQGFITLHERGFVIYENGKPVKMLGSLRDITKIKSLESELVQGKVKQQKELAEAMIEAQEKERKHLGYELHDNVNQLLATTRLFIGMIKANDSESLELKSKACEYVDAACSEIRNLSHGLVLTNENEMSLTGSFNKILSDLSLSDVFQISFDYDEKVESLDNATKTAFVRMLQEQLKNTIKYSKATRIDITLFVTNNTVELSIKDNGVGFDATNSKRGIGLSNINDRAELYNGRVELNTSPGNGCEMKVFIPISCN